MDLHDRKLNYPKHEKMDLKMKRKIVAQHPKDRRKEARTGGMEKEKGRAEG